MSDLEIRRLLDEATAAWKRGAHAVAADLGRRVLEKRRHHLDATMLLAEVAHSRRRYDEELDHVLTAVRHHPSDARLRNHLGRCYEFRAQYPRALGQYERAIKLDPDAIAPVAGKASTFECQGKFDKARSVLAPHVRDGATEPRIAAVHVRVLLREGRLDEAIELGTAVMDAGHDPSVPLRETCLVVAQAHERRGDMPEALAAARRANELLPIPWNPDTYDRATDELIATFTRARLERAPRPAEPSAVPVFVVGMPRSGSTLVERILATHPDAAGAGESGVMERLEQDLPWAIESTLPYPACVEDLEPADVERASRSYLDEVRRLAPRGSRVVDKDLDNHRRLGLIQMLLPGARVIHCRRRAMDTCLSCYMSPFEVPYARDLEHLGRAYRCYERLMEHWREVLDLPRLELDYERVVEDQEATTRRLLDFCGLPWHDACLRFHEQKRHERTVSYDQVRRPIYRSSIGRAERYGALLDPLREALGPACG